MHITEVLALVLLVSIFLLAGSFGAIALANEGVSTAILILLSLI